MTQLKFRRGYNEFGSNFDVEFHFDYDANFKKKIKALTFFNNEIHQKLTIPWVIFEYYAKTRPSRPFLSQSGLRMWFKNKELFISDYRTFNLNIYEEQMNSILIHAARSENKFSTAVEDVLKEFIAESV